MEILAVHVNNLPTYTGQGISTDFLSDGRYAANSDTTAFHAVNRPGCPEYTLSASFMIRTNKRRTSDELATNKRPVYKAAE
ncbi:hypothetical protein [Chitinophaga agri]|uniref:Uncharacterized protein n=1 Tax=Chitinophaga agri TaxID=2703787 RepID=A0A6B9Z9I3_9BACT|nr:hypothetical protein [Chitinophaga agri]QHS58646.1 hypothetical protein GWR21_03240 [Chitinophaga agri]